MKDILIYSLGAFIALSAALLIVFLLIYSPEEKQLINQSINTYFAAFLIMIGYYFGSSKGSSDKNEMLKNEKSKTN